MTRTVWFNCSAGVAGDMLLASLIDAGAERLAVMDAWAALGVDGYAATWERVQRCGISSLWTNLAIDDGDTTIHLDDRKPDDRKPDDEQPAEHDRAHRHGGDHHVHRPAREVLALIAGSDLSDSVRQDAMAVYRRLADVEGAIHATDPDDVELHEVGALDSILDVVGVCAALHDLGVEHIAHSPVALGHGTVPTAHGRLPNPVPAVTRLMADAGIATVGLDTTMELSTPTGVALLAVLGDANGAIPAMTVQAIGFGAGTADPPGRPNVVQAIIGDAAPTQDSVGRPCRLLEANVDDITGEVLAHTISALIAAGAHDAWATPIVMKKGRPAHTVAALCDGALFESVRQVMLTETGSLGVRASTVRRWPQRRVEHMVDVDGHDVRVKIADRRVKVEHDDARSAAAALGLPLREVIARAEQLGTHLD